MSVPASTRPLLRPNTYDVLVIGGGINGVAIAREAARGGLRTLIVEQSDFGSGTSSRSTRIIHGGLRYLEHGELGLVRESLRERDQLLRSRSHLVRPLDFILRMPKPDSALSLRSAWSIRAGLAIYERLSPDDRPEAARKASKTLEGVLDKGVGVLLFDYEDAQCEFPERLIAEWLCEAVQAGATARNHCQVLRIKTAHGKVNGAIVRDMLDGTETSITARWVVNASGPWVDQVCQNSALGERQLVGGVRGSHIVMPAFPGAPRAAVYTEAQDGRPFFVVPWNQQVLVGTTEVRDSGDPSRTAPTAEEVAYLFHSFIKIFPQCGLTPDDIITSFAGVRPLPYAPDAEAKTISRKHFIHDHKDDGAAGLLSIIGGKLTTAASLARDCVTKLGVKTQAPAKLLVAQGSNNGFELTLRQWAHQMSNASKAGSAFISAESARAVAQWHGRNALAVLRGAFTNPALAETLCPHSPHIVAEAVHAVQREGAVSLGDILLRRAPVALGACWDPECSRHAAAKIGAALGWNEMQIHFAMEDLVGERARFLRKPAPFKHSASASFSRQDAA